MRAFHAAPGGDFSTPNINRLDPATGCTKNFAGQVKMERAPDAQAAEALLGHPVVRLIHGGQGDKVKYAVREWRAPTLGCLALRQLARFPHASPTKPESTSEIVATSLTIGEDSWIRGHGDLMFSVPRDFKQVSLRALFEGNATRKGKSGPHGKEHEKLVQMEQEEAKRPPVDLSALRRR